MHSHRHCRPEDIINNLSREVDSLESQQISRNARNCLAVAFRICQDDGALATLVSLPDPALFLIAVCGSERARSETPFATGGACA
jgi:hypothetical protein